MNYQILSGKGLIIPNLGVAWLLSQCYDQELLLAWVLAFRYAVTGLEVRRLRGEAVVREHKTPVAFYLPRAADDRGWYIPIRPDDRALLKILIPASGGWFSNSDPIRRLCRLAGQGNIDLTRERILATCLAFAQASGDYHGAVVKLGQFKPPGARGHLGLPISSRAARKYWALTIPPRRAAALPRQRPET